MPYSKSEPGSNLLPVFASIFSKAKSESESESVFIILGIFIFFILYLQ